MIVDAVYDMDEEKDRGYERDSLENTGFGVASVSLRVGGY
jgi:hypothetical protein